MIVLALRGHNLEAGAPLLDELRHQLGRMLEVGIHHDHRLAARRAQTGAHRRLVAEIAGERDVADHRIGSGSGAQRVERAIGRAIVDADDLGAAEPPTSGASAPR